MHGGGDARAGARCAGRGLAAGQGFSERACDAIATEERGRATGSAGRRRSLNLYSCPVQLGTTKVDNFRYFAGKPRTLRKTTPFDEGSKLNKFQTERLCRWPTNRDLLVEGAQNIGHPSFLPLNSSKNGFRASFAHVLLFTRSKSDRSNAENRSK